MNNICYFDVGIMALVTLSNFPCKFSLGKKVTKFIIILSWAKLTLFHFTCQFSVGATS